MKCVCGTSGQFLSNIQYQSKVWTQTFGVVQTFDWYCIFELLFHIVLTQYPTSKHEGLVFSLLLLDFNPTLLCCGHYASVLHSVVE